jgi:hypothetical protein
MVERIPFSKMLRWLVDLEPGTMDIHQGKQAEEGGI